MIQTSDHRLYFYRRNYPVFVVLSILSSSITLLSSYLVAFVGMGRHGWDVIRTFGEQETYFKVRHFRLFFSSSLLRLEDWTNL